MTTATPTYSPPTADDFRRRLDQLWQHVTPVPQLDVDTLTTPVDAVYDVIQRLALAIEEPWDDLRPSEEEWMNDALGEAQHRAREAARRAIFEELIKVGMAFAERYPDAPRAEPATER